MAKRKVQRQNKGKGQSKRQRKSQGKSKKRYVNSTPDQYDDEDSLDPEEQTDIQGTDSDNNGEQNIDPEEMPIGDPYHDDDATPRSADDFSVEFASRKSPFVRYSSLLRFRWDDSASKYVFIPMARTYNGYHQGDESPSQKSASQKSYDASERWMVLDAIGRWFESNRQQFLGTFKVEDLVCGAYEEAQSGHYSFLQKRLLSWLSCDYGLKVDAGKFAPTFNKYINNMAVLCDGKEIMIDVLFSHEVKVAWAARCYWEYLRDKQIDWSLAWQEKQLRSNIDENMSIKDFVVPRCVTKDTEPKNALQRAIKNTIYIDKEFKDVLVNVSKNESDIRLEGETSKNIHWYDAPWKVAMFVMVVAGVKFHDVCVALDKQNNGR